MKQLCTCAFWVSSSFKNNSSSSLPSWPEMARRSCGPRPWSVRSPAYRRKTRTKIKRDTRRHHNCAHVIRWLTAVLFCGFTSTTPYVSWCSNFCCSLCSLVLLFFFYFGTSWCVSSRIKEAPNNRWTYYGHFYDTKDHLSNITTCQNTPPFFFRSLYL